ncbi:MAG: OmpA family protein [Hyphomicrobiaceae bacterium]|nr:MAG: OmpA family protein [Hyphomicrobiaceae bacterium]
MHCRGIPPSQVLAVAAMLHLMPMAQAGSIGLGRHSQSAVSVDPAEEFRMHVGDRVFFSEGSAQLGARARAALEAQAAWMLRYPTVQVTVEGHADDSGAGESDMVLAQRRAEAVRQRLVEAGVSPARIRTVAYGRARPVAACAQAACGAQNRRVVTVVGWPNVAVPETGITTVRDEAPGRRSPRRLF